MARPLIESVEKPAPTVVRANIQFKQGKNAEFWALLRSDAHHDSAYCDRALEKRHLEQARDRGAAIIDLGDSLDLMQNKGDPRSDRSQIRTEHLANAYFDKVIEEAGAFYAPYAENWLFMSPGNHEAEVVNRHGTCPTTRLAEQLRCRAKGKTPLTTGTYQGWIQFNFKWGVRHASTYRLRYTHGAGGGAGAPVTKDLIQANRVLSHTENADFIVSGHVHESWYVIQPREYLDEGGTPRVRNVALIKTGTYKDEFSPGGGWAVQRGHSPKPLGAWWLRFFQRGDRVLYEVIRAGVD